VTIDIQTEDKVIIKKCLFGYCFLFLLRRLLWVFCLRVCFNCPDSIHDMRPQAKLHGNEQVNWLNARTDVSNFSKSAQLEQWWASVSQRHSKRSLALFFMVFNSSSKSFLCFGLWISNNNKQTQTHILTHAHMHTHTRQHTSSHLQTRILTHANTHTHTNKHAYSHTQTRTLTHTNTHTHTRQHTSLHTQTRILTHVHASYLFSM